MIFHAVEQLSPEWFELRAGKMTASIASKILTATGKPSTQYKSEMGRIIAEREGWQEPEDSIETAWMTRGTELEAEARNWFTVETGEKVHTDIGFVESDCGLCGCSPDGIVILEDGPGSGKPILIPLELKVPKPSTHITWLIDGGLPATHKQQVHFQMAVMKAPYCYFMSYSQFCDPLIVKVESDDYTKQMVEAIDAYAAEFERVYKIITGVDL